MKEILIIVFSTMQFMGDLDSSNFKSITGTKLIGVGGNQGLESEKCKREHM